MSAVKRQASTNFDRNGARTHRLATLVRRAIVSIRRCFSAPTSDPRTRYLSEATDHADLERRARAYDELTRHRDALKFWL